MFLLNSQIPRIRKSGTPRANPSPEVTDQFAEFPYARMRRAAAGSHPGDPLRFRYGCAPRRARVLSEHQKRASLDDPSARSCASGREPECALVRPRARCVAAQVRCPRILTQSSFVLSFRLTLRGWPCRRNPPPSVLVHLYELLLLPPRSAPPRAPRALTATLLHTRVAPLPLGSIGTGSIAIHFQSGRIRWVRCNTLLTG